MLTQEVKKSPGNKLSYVSYIVGGKHIQTEVSLYCFILFKEKQINSICTHFEAFIMKILENTH